MGRDVRITPEGLEAVKRELEELVKVRRPYMADKIRSARELGDLSENFEYHAAKNEQGFLEARIAELDAIVLNAILIEGAPKTGRVEVGNTVRFVEDDGTEATYRIVGSAEADPPNGRLSFESAVGRAVLGHEVGEHVEVETPAGGTYTVHITAIE
ncbi:MAG: transcription elongation factor GreA [Candidatus Dormibacteraceae bacterium]